MSNVYNLPEKDLDKIRKRDKRCVYCHKEMADPKDGDFRGDWATIEHLNHLPPWDNPDTVAICCGSCNSSRRDLPLEKWFRKRYCLDKNINKNTVAGPVKRFIQKN